MGRTNVRLAAVVSALLGLAAPTVRAQAPVPADLQGQVETVRQDPSAIPIPPADSFTVGPRVVAAGTTVPGTVAVARGDLRVAGTIQGNAVAINGDVVVLPGGRVTGSAFAALGRVRLEGGVVDGEIRALGGRIGPVRTPVAQALSPTDTTFQSLKLALGWLAVLTMIGIGVLMFGSAHLDGVADALEQGVLRAFWIGVAGQLLALPALLILCVALAVTVIGILLVPFAIVAVLIALSGLLTLGFLATAHVTGRSLVNAGRRGLTARGGELRALVLGIVVFLALWVIAAALSWAPAAATSVRALALVVTWVAATAGFGAALRSRAGTRQESAARAVVPAAAPRALEDSFAWQTPTPVGGVVAARRPTPAPTGMGDR